MDDYLLHLLLLLVFLFLTFVDNNFILNIHRGNTLDSHRIIYFAGQQSSEKQHKLVEELFLGYFTQAKYVGDW